jgi:hypothetical protein
MVVAGNVAINTGGHESRKTSRRPRQCFANDSSENWGQIQSNLPRVALLGKERYLGSFPFLTKGKGRLFSA